jgi:hypothetical protein
VISQSLPKTVVALSFPSMCFAFRAATYTKTVFSGIYIESSMAAKIFYTFNIL